MSNYKAGDRLASAVCDGEIVVIGAPAEGAVISCGGVAMLAAGEEGGGELDAAFADGTELGKRYTTGAGDVELLCVKPGRGSLSIDGEALVLKGAKPLPSSD